MPLLQVKLIVTLPLAELLALDATDELAIEERELDDELTTDELATEELIVLDDLLELLAAILLELVPVVDKVMAWLVALKQMV